MPNETEQCADDLAEAACGLLSKVDLNGGPVVYLYLIVQQYLELRGDKYKPTEPKKAHIDDSRPGKPGVVHVQCRGCEIVMFIKEKDLDFQGDLCSECGGPPINCQKCSTGRAHWLTKKVCKCGHVNKPLKKAEFKFPQRRKFYEPNTNQQETDGTREV